MGQQLSEAMVPATATSDLPSYTVLDIAGDRQIMHNFRFLAGISNFTAKHYYNRVFQNGIEPAQDRKIYAGIALGL